MADLESITPNFQLSDADLEKLPPSALRLIIRQLLAHSVRQDQRIRELQTEVDRLKARLNQNSTNSSKPPSSDPPRSTTWMRPPGTTGAASTGCG